VGLGSSTKIDKRDTGTQMHNKFRHMYSGKLLDRSPVDGGLLHRTELSEEDETETEDTKGMMMSNMVIHKMFWRCFRCTSFFGIRRKHFFNLARHNHQSCVVRRSAHGKRDDCATNCRRESRVNMVHASVPCRSEKHRPWDKSLL
jgi:hypothetical protein